MDNWASTNLEYEDNFKSTDVPTTDIDLKQEQPLEEKLNTPNIQHCEKLNDGTITIQPENIKTLELISPGHYEIKQIEHELQYPKVRIELDTELEVNQPCVYQSVTSIEFTTNKENQAKMIIQPTEAILNIGMSSIILNL